MLDKTSHSTKSDAAHQTLCRKQESLAILEFELETTNSMLHNANAVTANHVRT